MARNTFQYFLKAACAATLVAGTVSAIELDINNEQSVKDAAATAAFNTMQHYNGNKTGESFESGYTQKKAISNGGLFQLSARLARYTHDQRHSTVVDNGCTTQGNSQWTANYGPYISGAAYMYNFTNGQITKWKSGLDGLLNVSLELFFPEKYGGLILSEILWDSFVSDLMLASLVAPYISPEVSSRLQASAVGAAKQCTGGNNQTLCGRRWYSDKWDGTDGRGEQLSATSIFFSNLAGFTEKSVATAAAAADQTTGSNGTNGTSANGTNVPIALNGAGNLSQEQVGVVTAGVLGGLVSIFVL
ncbi:hypothetical protein BO99DRAFT_443711 [Aspergillus violaceofuscus CBS 115571]|uniref:mannan endo-1,6-alpha-mannosidase n=1 Tax=Aspergillus violaceofuscus (strain CBS 115571) TaxID=1450538 RepID=A0A2V5IG59_ASPV1|nr:hypothetical protein BO99DRAFT_443711 [Aspergillus violaceofuscus CBS 115571]